MSSQRLRQRQQRQQQYLHYHSSPSSSNEKQQQQQQQRQQEQQYYDKNGEHQLHQNSHDCHHRFQYYKSDRVANKNDEVSKRVLSSSQPTPPKSTLVSSFLFKNKSITLSASSLDDELYAKESKHFKIYNSFSGHDKSNNQSSIIKLCVQRTRLFTSNCHKKGQLFLQSQIPHRYRNRYHCIVLFGICWMISVTFYSILYYHVFDLPYPDTAILLQPMLDITTNHAHKIYNGEDFWDGNNHYKINNKNNNNYDEEIHASRHYRSPVRYDTHHNADKRYPEFKNNNYSYLSAGDRLSLRIGKKWVRGKNALERFELDDDETIEENESTNSGHDSDDYADASTEKISRFETGKILQNEMQTKHRSADLISHTNIESKTRTTEHFFVTTLFSDRNDNFRAANTTLPNQMQMHLFQTLSFSSMVGILQKKLNGQEKCQDENPNHTNIEKCHRFNAHDKNDNNETHHLYWIISIPNKPELKDYRLFLIKLLKPFENNFFLISIEDDNERDSHNIRRGDTADGPFSNSSSTSSYCFWQLWTRANQQLLLSSSLPTNRNGKYYTNGPASESREQLSKLISGNATRLQQVFQGMNQKIHHVTNAAVETDANNPPSTYLPHVIETILPYNSALVHNYSKLLRDQVHQSFDDATSTGSKSKDYLLLCPGMSLIWTPDVLPRKTHYNATHIDAIQYNEMGRWQQAEATSSAANNNTNNRCATRTGYSIAIRGESYHQSIPAVITKVPRPSTQTGISFWDRLFFGNNTSISNENDKQQLIIQRKKTVVIPPDILMFPPHSSQPSINDRNHYTTNTTSNIDRKENNHRLAQEKRPVFIYETGPQKSIHEYQTLKEKRRQEDEEHGKSHHAHVYTQSMPFVAIQVDILTDISYSRWKRILNEEKITARSSLLSAKRTKGTLIDNSGSRNVSRDDNIGTTTKTATLRKYMLDNQWQWERMYHQFNVNIDDIVWLRDELLRQRLFLDILQDDGVRFCSEGIAAASTDATIESCRKQFASDMDTLRERLEILDVSTS